jgi:hypothetical protein
VRRSSSTLATSPASQPSARPADEVLGRGRNGGRRAEQPGQGDQALHPEGELRALVHPPVQDLIVERAPRLVEGVLDPPRSRPTLEHRVDLGAEGGQDLVEHDRVGAAAGEAREQVVHDPDEVSAAPAGFLDRGQQQALLPAAARPHHAPPRGAGEHGGDLIAVGEQGDLRGGAEAAAGRPHHRGAELAAAGSPHHELRVEHPARLRRPARRAEHGADGSSRQALDGLPDAGEGRRAHLREQDVVEADHRHLRGHVDPAPLELLDDAEGHGVVGGEDRVQRPHVDALLVEQACDRAAPATTVKSPGTISRGSSPSPASCRPRS